MPRGIFISFEGTEGSGKSTQIELLAEKLREQGRKVSCFREPGGTPFGETIRAILKADHPGGLGAEAELLLFNAARAELVRSHIAPTLARGDVVLCDRFFDSTVAYQGYGRGLPLESVRAVIQLAAGNIVPEITFLLQVPIEISEARRQHREKKTGEKPDRFEQDSRDFFRRIEEGYSRLAAAEPSRIVTIDATQPPFEVASAIWQTILHRLKIS